MLHFYFLRFWLLLGMRGWFRRMYVHWKAPIPTDAPVIFASTHPNSAVDYLMAPLFTQQPVHVLVRGDVFQNPFLNRFFRAIFMLPVYRFRDGYKSLGKNQQSFEECYRFFDKKSRVLIFTEGICIQEKVLQPLRKGTARLALDYIKKHGGEKIYIVPLASNYTRFRSFRASVMVNFGEAIDATKYSDLYDDNANKAYEALTAEIREALESQYIIQKDYADDSPTEQALMALRLNRPEHKHNWIVESQEHFLEEQRLVQRLNQTNENALSEQWRSTFTQAGIGPVQEGALQKNLGTWFYLLQVLLLSPVMALAGLTVAMPYLASRWIVRSKIKDIIFTDTVVIFGSAVIYLLTWLAVLIIAVMNLGAWGMVVPMLMLLVTTLGIDLIDDYRYAISRLTSPSKREAYEKLYQEVVALTSP